MLPFYKLDVGNNITFTQGESFSFELEFFADGSDEPLDLTNKIFDTSILTRWMISSGVSFTPALIADNKKLKLSLSGVQTALLIHDTYFLHLTIKDGATVTKPEEGKILIWVRPGEQNES